MRGKFKPIAGDVEKPLQTQLLAIQGFAKVQLFEKMENWQEGSPKFNLINGFWEEINDFPHGENPSILCRGFRILTWASIWSANGIIHFSLLISSSQIPHSSDSSQVLSFHQGLFSFWSRGSGVFVWRIHTPPAWPPFPSPLPRQHHHHPLPQLKWCCALLLQDLR